LSKFKPTPNVKEKPMMQHILETRVDALASSLRFGATHPKGEAYAEQFNGMNDALYVALKGGADCTKPAVADVCGKLAMICADNKCAYKSDFAGFVYATLCYAATIWNELDGKPGL
jgi:hypothetical protein